MTGDLIAYEIGGQRRCILAPAGWRHLVGSAEHCHVPLASEGMPDVLFSFVRDGMGRMRVLDENNTLMDEAALPLEFEVLGMPLVMFEPGDLLEAPFAVDPHAERTLVLQSGEDGRVTMLAVPAGELVCAGGAPDAEIVLPDGPNFACVMWWDGAARVHLAVLDNSEGAEWESSGIWGQRESVTLPITLRVGACVCELRSEPLARRRDAQGNSLV